MYLDAVVRVPEAPGKITFRVKGSATYALAKLSDLLDKRDALRRDELIKAILKSDKTYEEVLEFLESGTDEEDE